MTTSRPAPALHVEPDDLIRAWVRPGMHLHLASTPSRPNALIRALARCFEGRSPAFTISTTALQGHGHALAVAGVVARAITCFVGDNYPSPRPCSLYGGLLEDDPFVLEQWSILSLVQRLAAGAQGLPYAVTRSLVGSDLARGKEGVLHVCPDPSDPSSRIALLRSLRPDLTLVHGVCADDRGNVVLRPPVGEGVWGALAARQGVLATVERIVPRRTIAALSDRVLVPAHRVLGICEAPFGAHPQSLRAGGLGDVRDYLDDGPALCEVSERCRTAGGAREWYAEFVGRPRTHREYLQRVGPEQLDALTAPPPPRPAPVPSGEPAAGERLLALAARAIVDLVLERGYDTILAGIGASHVAAWVAERRLRARGVTVRLLAEMGFYGTDPHPGDVYLFSKRHMERCEQLAGVLETLGCYVAGGVGKCLGVLGAGEVDASGNINSTRARDGRYLIGSGGANDIASTVDCLVVAREGRDRLVRQVGFQTSPGRNTLGVVTSFGRFVRDAPSRSMQLASWLPGAVRAATPAAAVEAFTAWPASSGPVTEEEPIGAEERNLIWEIDADAVYRR